MPDDRVPPAAAGHGLRWVSVVDMVAGDEIEVPVDDDGPPRWLRVVAVKPPWWTGEWRWALNLADGPDEWWVKASPDLVFRAGLSRPPPDAGPDSW